MPSPFTSALKTAAGRAVWCIAGLLACQIVPAQSTQSTRPQQAYAPRKDAGLSALTQENLDRVAASAVQIREILVKDAGLLVELKRWVAKEAGDNGQVVKDSDLYDEAIFERLDHDVAFRAVATRLVQRYGYLLPAPNPDSNYAKEQELVLKERARRLVQIETQEDSESLRPKTEQDERELEQTRTCDPQDRNCEYPERARPRQSRSRNDSSSPDNYPNTQPDIPNSAPAPRAPQTDLAADQSPLSSRASTGGIELAAQSSSLGSIAAGSDAALSAQVPDLLAGSDLNALKNAYSANPDQTPVRDGPSRTQNFENRYPTSLRKNLGQREEDLTPVRMVRPANP